MFPVAKGLMTCYAEGIFRNLTLDNLNAQKRMVLPSFLLMRKSGYALRGKIMIKFLKLDFGLKDSVYDLSSHRQSFSI